MTLGVIYTSLMRRWKLGIISFLFGASLASACFGSEEEKVEDEQDWQAWDAWCYDDERAAPLAKQIKKAGFSVRQVAFPTAGTPDFFRAAKFQELFNDLLAYLDRWLEGFHLVYPPIGERYQTDNLPGDPQGDFLDDVTWHDALLMPALTYLIHMALSKGSPLSPEEQLFLDFRLRWLNEVMFPEGMQINWEEEYDELFRDYESGWDNSIKIPSFSFASEGVSKFLKEYKAEGMAIKKLKLLKDSIRKREYHEDICMKTTWNDQLSLYNAHFDFEQLNQSADPMLKSYVLFSMAASLRGPYFHEEKLAASYWLRVDEIELGLGSHRKKAWKEMVNSFKLTEGTIKKMNPDVIVKKKVTDKPKVKLRGTSQNNLQSNFESKIQSNSESKLEAKSHIKGKGVVRKPSSSHQERKPVKSLQIGSLPERKRIHAQLAIGTQSQRRAKSESDWQKGKERVIWPAFMGDFPAQEAFSYSSKSKEHSREFVPLKLGVGSTSKIEDKDEDDLEPLQGDILRGIIQGIMATRPPPIIQKNPDVSPVLTCTPSSHAPANGMIWFSDSGARRTSEK